LVVVATMILHSSLDHRVVFQVMPDFKDIVLGLCKRNRHISKQLTSVLQQEVQCSLIRLLKCLHIKGSPLDRQALPRNNLVHTDEVIRDATNCYVTVLRILDSEFQLAFRNRKNDLLLGTADESGEIRCSIDSSHHLEEGMFVDKYRCPRFLDGRFTEAQIEKVVSSQLAS